MDQNGKFLADLWKRFIVDEELDCHVNCSFTSKRRFGSSMKIQGLNYENIPVVEESGEYSKTCEQLKRRVVAVRLGKGVFTSNPAEVNEEAGAVKLIPQEHLTAFLQHPVTAALYLREWRLPFFKENSLDDCLGMIGDLKAVSAELHQDLEWLASRLSGSTSQPPDTQQTWAEKSDELVVVAHSKTPMKAIIKEYLIQKVDPLPGNVASSKGKRTRVQNFVAALGHTQVKLFL